ncbi:Dihydrodipicolinate synthase [Massospora cicadina]|nr:Dihydrodipicolinate synthase [Massospora cicadina]
MTFASSYSVTTLYAQLIDNPLNWGLLGVLSLLILTVYNSESSDRHASNPSHPDTLGDEFDVTPGRNFYGPGGPYENFAGRDASRGLALNSFDLEVLTPLDAPIDTLDNLSPDELSSLDDWVSHFRMKYVVVGKLVPAKG